MAIQQIVTSTSQTLTQHPTNIVFQGFAHVVAGPLDAAGGTGEEDFVGGA